MAEKSKTVHVTVDKGDTVVIHEKKDQGCDPVHKVVETAYDVFDGCIQAVGNVIFGKDK